MAASLYLLKSIQLILQMRLNASHSNFLLNNLNLSVSIFDVIEEPQDSTCI